MAPVFKRRKIDAKQVDEITFDPTARQEYLTGFHKRKVARKETAREQAIKRDKEEKVTQRQQIRKERKEDLEKHVKEVDEVLRRQNPDMLSDAESDAEDASGKADGWNGVGDEDAEYVDEDKYTTVTVEAMGDPKADEANHAAEEDAAKAAAAKASKDDAGSKKRIWSKLGPDGKPKPKKPKFRYESKAERQQTRQKQKNKSKAAKARREKGDKGE
ncbi:hypothetical protein LTR36_002366 [Oleoguttula mirabilis]|uniref:Ribosomal RNA-processing protein 17 n=1 Tax=Oleoguttula mirabilis TaxID=1507867 RepID=A0AAV9JLK9_9PEZI|nr:hypothetical protein LTR36_002366 [Oleoguttula mirabilis]